MDGGAMSNALTAMGREEFSRTPSSAPKRSGVCCNDCSDLPPTHRLPMKTKTKSILLGINYTFHSICCGLFYGVSTVTGRLASQHWAACERAICRENNLRRAESGTLEVKPDNPETK